MYLNYDDVNFNYVEQVECYFLGWLIDNPEYLLTTNIEDKYFIDNDNALLFKILKETYKEYGNIDGFNLSKQKEYNPFLFVKAMKIKDTQLCISNDKDKIISQLEEAIIEHYKEEVINNLSKKNTPVSEYIKTLSDLEEISPKSNEKGVLTTGDVDISSVENIVSVKSGTNKLDNLIRGFKLGQLSVWSGSNGSAKSTYLNQIAIFSIIQGFNVAIYSGELEPRRLLDWLFKQIATKSRMKYNKEKDYWYVPTEIKQNIQKELNNKLFIYNNSLGNKPKEIIKQLQKCIKKNNIKVLIIDNLMSVDLTGYGENQYVVQSKFTQELVDLCKQEQVHIHFVCHPRKTTTFLRKNDISGTADITNKADNVFILHRVNNDFKRATKEMFKWSDDYPLYEYTNVIEICKNRDYGIEDKFIGMYYEPCSKRLYEGRNDDG